MKSHIPEEAGKRLQGKVRGPHENGTESIPVA